jgi:hypothetical protein
MTFPQPCSQQWEDMAPAGCNRHCATCDQTIFDLSKLTGEQAEALLRSDPHACVRASITPDGSIRTADFAQRNSRRIFTAIGASVSLAATACTTTTAPNISPRYHITGTANWTSWQSKFMLRSEAGKIYRTAIDRDNRIKFGNLRPGTYRLSYDGSCDVIDLGEITVSQDVDLGDIKEASEGDCIIVGMAKIEEITG